jgi:sulfur carrier protein
MRIKINGKEENTAAGTVADLLKSKDIEPQMVSVEYNGRVLNREEYPTTPLSDGAAIELLFFMGGGEVYTGAGVP